ncbi:MULTISPECIES: urease accessory UreF family protein [Rhodopseudomonas]|uniref:urease accessory protein UreF n=1 Tax=Rhodopseudomonas TaxID=1073 RepID=UPI001F30D4FA|nr:MULTISPECIES: urease accessory UreF family protein [Rhodopseudomonas]MDF3808853.1 urease accessory UreF family protein [Rhodopseudomonas sp. BAL398]WOK19847.1 urease accessory UreF family protein [Rhodopseudomonas sp. BAL398]
MQAIWQADGSFPSGSFAFSYGIEGLIALRGNVDATALLEIISGLLRQRWNSCDRVALLRAFRAGGNIAEIAVADRDVEASTFGVSMREGSRRNGGAFLASHARLADGIASTLRKAVRSGECLGHITVMQGAVWQELGLDEELAQLTSGYAIASSAVAAAVRLGAIGALEGQKVLAGSLPLIEQLMLHSIPTETELRSFLPYLEVAAARHTRADLRLFAN